MEQITAGFNPALQLDHNERAFVAATVATPGYPVIHRLMRSEVDKFIIDLINVGEDDDQLIVARHKLAKAAAQFYQQITNRINHELSLYMAAVSASGSPVDPTEGILEIGEPASTIEDLEHDELLGEEENLSE